MTEATGGSAAVAAPVAIDDPHASEEAAKLAEPEHFPGHVGQFIPREAVFCGKTLRMVC